MSEAVMQGLVYFLFTCEFFFDIYFMGCVFKAKMKWSYRFILIAVMILVRVLTDNVFPVGSPLALIVLNVVYISFHIIPYSGSFWKRFGITMLLFFLELPGELATAAICNYYQIDYAVADHFYAAIIAYIFYNTLMMFGVWIVFIRKKWTKRISLFLLFPFYQMFILALFLMMRNIPLENRVIVGVSTTVFNVWLVITVIHVFQGMMERIEKEEHLEMLSKQMQYELQYYKNVEHRIEDLRDIRHDFLNQVQTTLLLLKSGEHQESVLSQRKFAEMVHDAKDAISSYYQGKWCSNPVADAIIFLKSEEAVKNDIRFEAECDLDEKLVMDNVDLCCVLGNLLDNAIEANGDAEDDRRFIHLTAAEADGKMKITCLNYTSVPPKEKQGVWITGKKDKKAHGRGLRTIEKICDKYHGSLQKKCVDNVVEITMEI